MTATAPVLTAVDLEAVITVIEKEIAHLQSEMTRLGIAHLRHEPGADDAYRAAEKKLDAARHEHRLASDAIIALAGEEAAAAEAVHAEEQAKAEQRRATAEKRLSKRLSAIEVALSALTTTLEPALTAADEVYNSGLVLGISHGQSTAVRDRIEARVNHVLRLAGLPGFDLSMSPSGRQPLSGEVVANAPVLAEAAPERDRRDVREDLGDGIVGTRIVQSFLRDDGGNWVEVPVGATELSAAEESTTFSAPELEPSDLAAEALARQARHRKEDAVARAAKTAAAKVLVPGEERS